MINQNFDGFLDFKQILELSANDHWNAPLWSLPRGSELMLNLDRDIDSFNEILPTEYYIKRLDKNVLEILPNDDLNNKVYLLSELNDYPLAWSLYLINRLNATTRVLEKYSVAEPMIRLETDDQHFYYTFTLSGETIGEIFDKVILMYDEISRETGNDEMETIIKYFNSKYLIGKHN